MCWHSLHWFISCPCQCHRLSYSSSLWPEMGVSWQALYWDMLLWKIHPDCDDENILFCFWEFLPCKHVGCYPFCSVGFRLHWREEVYLSQLLRKLYFSISASHKATNYPGGPYLPILDKGWLIRMNAVASIFSPIISQDKNSNSFPLYFDQNQAELQHLYRLCNCWCQFSSSCYLYMTVNHLVEWFRTNG